MSDGDLTWVSVDEVVIHGDDLAELRAVVEAARAWHQSRRFYALVRLRYLDLPNPELQARTPDQLLVVDAFVDAEDLHNHNAAALAAAVEALPPALHQTTEETKP